MEYMNNKRILVVDDEQDIALTLGEGLVEAGYDIKTFNDPALALSEFKAGAYDLLLLDVKMPGMTGFELYRKIKDIDSKVNVCFITAFESYHEEFKREFFPLGNVKGFIQKPITIEDLIKFIDEII
jgi:DNA-binding response OmpR family regulator